MYNTYKMYSYIIYLKFHPCLAGIQKKLGQLKKIHVCKLIDTSLLTCIAVVFVVFNRNVYFLCIRIASVLGQVREWKTWPWFVLMDEVLGQAF